MMCEKLNKARFAGEETCKLYEIKIFSDPSLLSFIPIDGGQWQRIKWRVEWVYIVWLRNERVNDAWFGFEHVLV